MVLKRFQTPVDVANDVPVVGCAVYGDGIVITDCGECEFGFGSDTCEELFAFGRSRRLVGVERDV